MTKATRKQAIATGRAAQLFNLLTECHSKNLTKQEIIEQVEIFATYTDGLEDKAAQLVYALGNMGVIDRAPFAEQKNAMQAFFYYV
jgi:hypothetical protein